MQTGTSPCPEVRYTCFRAGHFKGDKMSDSKLQIAKDLIEVLIVALQTPPSEQSYVEKMEIVEDAKIVNEGLGKK
jgi:hypothetical protein